MVDDSAIAMEPQHQGPRQHQLLVVFAPVGPTPLRRGRDRQLACQSDIRLRTPRRRCLSHRRGATQLGLGEDESGKVAPGA